MYVRCWVQGAPHDKRHTLDPRVRATPSPYAQPLTSRTSPRRSVCAGSPSVRRRMCRVRRSCRLGCTWSACRPARRRREAAAAGVTAMALASPSPLTLAPPTLPAP
eukprot:5224320-Prymnesium_polylepis.1